MLGHAYETALYTHWRDATTKRRRPRQSGVSVNAVAFLALALRLTEASRWKEVFHAPQSRTVTYARSRLYNACGRTWSCEASVVVGHVATTVRTDRMRCVLAVWLQLCAFPRCFCFFVVSLLFFFCCVLFLSRCRVCVFWCWCVQQRDCIFLHTSLALSLLYFFKMPYRGNTDLLHPDKAQEAKTHKLKRLVQSPNSFFMDVRCPGCTAM